MFYYLFLFVWDDGERRVARRDEEKESGWRRDGGMREDRIERREMLLLSYSSKFTNI